MVMDILVVLLDLGSVFKEHNKNLKFLCFLFFRAVVGNETVSMLNNCRLTKMALGISLPLSLCSPTVFVFLSLATRNFPTIHKRPFDFDENFVKSQSIYFTQ